MWYWIILIGAIYPLIIAIIALIRAVYLIIKEGREGVK